MLNAKEIEFFRNLSEWDFDQGNYWDLHNDFGCVAVKLDAGVLILRFSALSDKTPALNLEFNEAEITQLNLSADKSLVTLTLDNLYRGRFQVDDRLIDVDDQGRGYFYLEFYEGPTLEFWSGTVKMTVNPGQIFDSSVLT